MSAGWGLANSLITVFSYLLVLRFLLQAVQADFYNPVSQYVLKFSDPVCGPIRRFFPAQGRVDIASFLLAVVLQLSFMAAYFNATGAGISAARVIAFSGFNITNILLNVYFVALIVMVIMSWLVIANPAAGRNPFYPITHQIVEPLAAPIRRIIPPIGGLDLSVLVLFLGIQFAKNLNGQFWSLLVQ